MLARSARAPPGPDQPFERFVCQATELQRATSPMDWYDLRQYWRELRSGNVSLTDFFGTVARAAYNFVQRRRGRPTRPCVVPRAAGRTPTARLDLVPGDLVTIKTKAEIEATLDASQKNRGLRFDVEMLPYCGRTARVKARVQRIIEEETGRMLTFASDCIMLEGVVCGGRLSHDRLFCPRAIYPWWREIWLERVDDAGPAAAEERTGA